MPIPPQTLIVHTREDVFLASSWLKNNPHHKLAQLATTHDAACYYGAAMMLDWQNLTASGRLLIGCSGDSALAHELLKLGALHLYLRADTGMFLKLRDIAAHTGAVLYEDYPPHLVDMQQNGWEKQLTHK
jgi:hypothetical protein